MYGTGQRNTCMTTLNIHSLCSPLSTSRIATIEVQIAKLDSEAWPGLLDPERDRLILINEKEELLKELQYIKPCKKVPIDQEKIETQKKRLERDLQAARDNQSKALTERLRLHCKRNKLVRELEEMVRLASSLHTQLKRYIYSPKQHIQQLSPSYNTALPRCQFRRHNHLNTTVFYLLSGSYDSFSSMRDSDIHQRAEMQRNSPVSFLMSLPSFNYYVFCRVDTAFEVTEGQKMGEQRRK
ncbi:unnamed protein product [Oncorhynchus mykiss]|uniref:WWC1-like helical hairpin domain-containing protein n=1 Tax=Oncorhynchus mykiss TaxID=8022 RepID=A0A060WVL7_ONCMY|nr:unnamed protein product [Oncorhynchus mykiss]